jgi:1-acyl-sn-glycerol-3-phosphate acyltransferase
MVFPEGTRTEDGKIKGFKKGAFVLAAKTGVPVVPVAIAGSFGAINKNRWNIDPGSIHVKILEPIRTEGMDYKDRDKLKKGVEASITAGVEALRREHDLPFETAAMDKAQEVPAS